jgi:hypothetical protein
MKKILAVVLILAGGWLLYAGYQRGDSLAGRTKSTLAELKNDIDGKTRVPGHVKFYVGGAVLLAAGAWLATRRS